MLGSLIVYLKGMRIMMFQLSGYYYTPGALTVTYTMYFECSSLYLWFNMPQTSIVIIEAPILGSKVQG